MFEQSSEVLAQLEKTLSQYCPSPENDLNQLTLIGANLPEGEQFAIIRRLMLDLDDLIAEIRWHLGQALLLIETYPQLTETDTENASDDKLEQQLRDIGMPSEVQLLLRSYILQPDRVFYSDLSRSRKGGTVAGWIMHMMVDDAIYRVIASLDRLAYILWQAANLPLYYLRSGKQEKQKIYFRSGKVKKIEEVLKCSDSAELVKISESPLMEFIVEYRDGFAHEFKSYSKIAGSPPSDQWQSPDGKLVVWDAFRWDAETLFALGRAAYDQLIQALKYAVPICARSFPSVETYSG